MGETAPQPGPRLTRSVVLVGMMGSGKTAIGRALAARLGVEMRDSDAEIVEAAQQTIADIFERYGEAFFRSAETKVIARLLKGPPCILSTGGGAWLTEENRTRLNAAATVIWLEADLELLWARVKHKSHRPLLQTADPKATLAELLAAREGVYALAPHKVRAAPHWSIDQTADRVMEILQATDTLAEASTP